MSLSKSHVPLCLWLPVHPLWALHWKGGIFVYVLFLRTVCVSRDLLPISL
jgi:hypothetical protein